MTRTRLVPMLRRVAVLGLVLAALVGGAAAVRIAADWRAAEAMLDVVPVSAPDIDEDLSTQWDRTADIEARLERLADDLGGLEDAVAAADQAVEGKTGDADRLAGQFDDARRRLRDDHEDEDDEDDDDQEEDDD